jgi:hypothetical protein
LAENSGQRLRVPPNALRSFPAVSAPFRLKVEPPLAVEQFKSDGISLFPERAARRHTLKA